MVEGACEAPSAAKRGEDAGGRKPWHTAKVLRRGEVED